MGAPLVVVPFALELTVLVTTIAPAAFEGRFSKRPNFGIAAWLTSFLVAFISTAIALAISVWSVFDTWYALEYGTQPLWQTLVFSFAPWVLLGLVGISMAIVTQRFEPIRQFQKSDAMMRRLPSERIAYFRGIEVRSITLSSWFAFTIGKSTKSIIYVSNKVHTELSSKQFEALLCHEFGHVKLRHNSIKSLVAAIRQIGGPMLASRLLTSEIDRLCEISADHFALKSCDRNDLLSARANFR